MVLAMIRVKKAIDVMTMYEKKEDFVDWKLAEFLKSPIAIQKEYLISEQKRIFISLNLNNKFILNLINEDLRKTTSL